jgi:DNA-binding XRE family transcriptional regulator
MELQYLQVGKNKMAVLNIKECEDILDYIEDLEDSLIALKRSKMDNKIISFDEIKKEFLFNRIKEKRISKNITQEILADKLKTSQAYISKIETLNYRPTIAVLEKVAKVLECSVEDLV